MRVGSGAVDGLPSGWTDEPSWAIIAERAFVGPKSMKDGE